VSCSIKRLRGMEWTIKNFANAEQHHRIMRRSDLLLDPKPFPTSASRQEGCCCTFSLQDLGFGLHHRGAIVGQRATGPA